MKKGLTAALLWGLMLSSSRPALPGNIQNTGAKPVEIEFSFQLILGSVSSEDRTDEALKNDPVIKELKTLMKYSTFLLQDAGSLRTKEKTAALTILGKQRQYILALTPVLKADDKGGEIQTDIRFSYNFPGQKNADLIHSTIFLKPGERTVVGVSKPQDREPVDQGLILIITGKPIRQGTNLLLATRP